MSRVVAVLGAGGWGTALAVHLARINHDVRLWARDPDLVARLGRERTNAVYLPGVPLPEAVVPVASLAAALDGVALVVAAVPSHGTRSVMRLAAPHVAPGATIVSTTKGLEQETLFRMSEVVRQELGSGHDIVAVSGPSFAAEVARDLPTAVCAASSSPEAVERVLADFRGPHFRLYGSGDVVGVEIGGALKNVIAIGSGVAEGLGLGHNAVAGLITRGLAEIARLACAAGADRQTLAGLAGLGDLVLTCTGGPSRNRRVGLELAQGRRVEEIVANMKMVAEGVRTARAALALGARHGLEMPIASQVEAVLAGRTDPRTALSELMLRPQRAEAG
ncbi:MAG: NAD(P)-dependent glycerol-3-phosphate dehydrogenase [Acidimicrobiia bacterium]|nr:NAD(P)-dependent glycerol-3-phosphate dehydrogenase [Acidimicrobiia bacterium]